MKVDFRDTWAFKFGFVFAAYGIIYFILAFGFVRTVFAEYLIPSLLWVGLGGTLILISRFSNSMSGIRGIWDQRTITWRIGLISFWLTIIYSLTDLFKFEREHIRTLKYHQPKTYLYFLIGILFLLIGWLTDKSIPKPKFHKTWSFKLGLIFLIYALFFGILAPDSSSSILPGLIAYISVCAAAGIALIVHGIILKKPDGQKGLWKGRTWNWRLGLTFIFIILPLSIVNLSYNSDDLQHIIKLSGFYEILGFVFMIAGGVSLKDPPPGKLGLWKNRSWPWRTGLLMVTYSLFIHLFSIFNYFRGGELSFLYLYWAFFIFGVILMIASSDRPRRDLPPGKIGLWEGRPQLWKIGVVFIIWNCINIIDTIQQGTLLNKLSSVASAVRSFTLIILGVIFILTSILTTKKGS